MTARTTRPSCLVAPVIGSTVSAAQAVRRHRKAPAPRALYSTKYLQNSCRWRRTQEMFVTADLVLAHIMQIVWVVSFKQAVAPMWRLVSFKSLLQNSLCAVNAAKWVNTHCRRASVAPLSCRTWSDKTKPLQQTRSSLPTSIWVLSLWFFSLGALRQMQTLNRIWTCGSPTPIRRETDSVHKLISVIQFSWLTLKDRVLPCCRNKTLHKLSMSWKSSHPGGA